MTKIEHLKAQVAAKVAETTAAVKEQVEVAQLEAKLNVLSNDNLIVARARMELISATSKKLSDLEMQCQQVISSMPIYSAKTRENRKWNPSRQYGMGNQIATLTGILSGIQYSATEHKRVMLEMTGFSEDLVEQTLEAFGNVSYYSRNNDLVVEDISYDMEAILSNIAIIEQILDIDLDKKKLNNTIMRQRFEVARVRAERQKAEAEATLALRED